jgi:tRNA-dihydrouridine synthase C
MEGVIDALMRKILCSINDYDLCIIEFVRIVDSLLPPVVYHRICPELKLGAYTGNNTPVRIQLLGQDPDWMAENAVRAIELGSNGIDVNFGCPAKAVNKSKGGAVLLKDPDKIYAILLAIKKAIGNDALLSAKIRLGFDDTSQFTDIVSAVESAGTNDLAIHARTKTDGYKPPAYWNHINQAVKQSNLNIIANGEIWGRDSALACIKSSGTTKLMVGRGGLALPNLGNVIKQDEKPMTWSDIQDLLNYYSKLELEGDKSFYFSSRLKQWLRYLRLQYPQGEQLFRSIKTLKDKDTIIKLINVTP